MIPRPGPSITPVNKYIKKMDICQKKQAWCSVVINFNEIPCMSHKNFWNGETKKAVKGIHSEAPLYSPA